MNGGAGNDIFVFAAGFGNDKITTFDANADGGGQDRIDISALWDNELASTWSSTSAGPVRTPDHDRPDTITLLGVAAGAA